MADWWKATEEERARMGMPERKSAEARREQIIATALDLAHEVGPDRMTTEAIARRTAGNQR